MKHIIRFAAYSSVLLLSVASSPGTVMAVGETQSKHLVIAELSPESVQSASQEYVVLYNPDTSPVDVTGWQLQYRSASHVTADPTGWTIKAILGCQTTKVADCTHPAQTVIDVGDTVRLSSFETTVGILPLASGMATAGGQVRLVAPATGATPELVYDLVGYGSAAIHEGLQAAIAPQAGRSIVRRQDAANNYIDTDNNAQDFMLSENEDTAPPVGDPSSPNQPATPVTYLSAEITEVMPDPASPQLDSADEFVELYNPYDTLIDLTGYVLQAGANWNYKYKIQDITLEPHEYLALLSSQTHLSLSNSGSGVRLYDPNGTLQFEVPSYGKAQTGQSWVRNTSDQWVWTTELTPGEENVVAIAPAPEPTVTSASAAKKTTAKTTTTSTKKTAAPKTSSGAVKGTSTTQPAQLPTQAKNNVTLLVLLALGLIAGGYLLYEYRYELGATIRRAWTATNRRKGGK